MKKVLLWLTCVIIVVSTCLCMFTACDTTPNDDPIDNTDKIEYQEYLKNTIGFNDNSDPNLSSYDTSMYYLNAWENFDETASSVGFPDMGDPFILYYEGYYYAYGTRGTTTFHCFRSKDLSHWERLPDCFTPESGSWSRYNLWAPDIQKIGDKFYLYYTAKYEYADGTDHCQIGVAIADTPYGPFKQFAGTNALGDTITLADTPFQGLEKNTILDATVFQDDDGELYMYFSFDLRGGDEEHRKMATDSATAEIWGVKMIDAVTWDISTLTPLLCAGYQKYTDAYPKIAWERWSPSFDSITGMECLEGPYMFKSNGKYYLTYCANSYVDINYAVGYAVSDNPLSGFEKPNDTYLENMLLGVPAEAGTYTANRYVDFMTGTGHASIFQTGSGEYMFAYHAHYTRGHWGEGAHGEWRCLSVDYIYFNDDGVPYTNGPTYSLQNTPSDVSGYSNIIGRATVKGEGENIEYLTDNYTSSRFGTKEPDGREATFERGTRSIEITFSEPVTVRAVNIYNSFDASKTVDAIKQIDFGNGNGIVNAQFNSRYYSEKYSDFVYPHAAFNILLDEELTTDRIVITISSEFDFALGEIEIIGK